MAPDDRGADLVTAPSLPGPAGAGLAGLASRDGLDGLAARMRPALDGNPDADEVAAALEAAGLTDQSVRRDFGQPDLFSLAGRLLPRLARVTRARRHAAAPVRLDWSGLGRPRLVPARLAAAAALGAAAWWLGTRADPAVVVPVVAGIPLADLLLAWRAGYTGWGLSYHDSAAGWRTHLRTVGRLTLAALATPLLVAAGLAGAATHRPGLLGVATGTLAAGGYPMLLVLTARRRFLAGASLVAATAAGTLLTHPSLPRMCLLAGGYLTGLGLVAYAVLDPRSHD
jgi:hypothetical protein